MLARTTERIEHNTSERYRIKIDERLRASIERHMHADRSAINARLAELDREWNIERMIEVEAPLMIGLGLGLGLFVNRRWFGLSAFAASMVILHNTQGWYPLLPLFQRMGLRSQNAIEEERMALKILRGDHKAYTQH